MSTNLFDRAICYLSSSRTRQEMTPAAIRGTMAMFLYKKSPIEDWIEIRDYTLQHNFNHPCIIDYYNVAIAALQDGATPTKLSKILRNHSAAYNAAIAASKLGQQ